MQYDTVQATQVNAPLYNIKYTQGVVVVYLYYVFDLKT